ncbi:MAG: SRPBCC family protein [Acidimicrobiia bacterium]|nr:SRPBCC family protein [Acidimicrobiia bacterium]
MRLEEQRWVSRPQRDAFEYTADFSNISDWDPGVVASEKVTPGQVGVGTEFDLDVKFGNRTAPMRYRITEYQPDTRVVLVGEGRQLRAVDEIVFETQDNMTRIDYTADLQFRGYMRLVAPFLGKALEKVGEKALDGLESALSR